MKITSMVCAGLLLAGSLRAAEVAVTTLGLAGERSSAASAALHVFGGRPAELELAVEAPLGSRVSVGRALFQIAGGLAAPLGTERVGEPLDFARTTRRIVRVPLAPPEVERRSELLVRLHTQTDGQPRVGAGAIRLFVYPQNQLVELTTSLARIAQDTGLALAVFGESARIRTFLEESKIPFTDAGPELPDSLRPTALYLGEVAAPAVPRPRSAGARVIFFAADPALLPGVYTTVSESSLFAKVTLPLLETLATNPQSQHAFIDILRQCLDPSAFTPAPSP